ncbi:MAG: RidA family protein [Armatimonadetes bacterium]|nr:RidA family protein [Armatimonadota bacterium]
MKEIIATAEAPAALGPYAQAVKVNDTIFVSGQLPLHPKNHQMVTGAIGAQTEQVLTNIRSILEEGGAHLNDIVKVTIYMKNLGDFDEMNRVYELFFPNSDTSTNLLPARSTVEVARLPRDAAIEIDCIAIVTNDYMTPELF